MLFTNLVTSELTNDPLVALNCMLSEQKLFLNIFVCGLKYQNLLPFLVILCVGAQNLRKHKDVCNKMCNSIKGREYFCKAAV